MTEPHVFTHEKYTVCLFGPERPRTRILPVIYRGNRNKVCLVKAASDSTHPGFMQIKPPVYGSSESNDFDEYADSIVIEESGSSVIMQTADCLTGILFEHTTKRGVIIHCGKFALMPQNEFGKPPYLFQNRRLRIRLILFAIENQGAGHVIHAGKAFVLIPHHFIIRRLAVNPDGSQQRASDLNFLV